MVVLERELEGEEPAERAVAGEPEERAGGDEGGAEEPGGGGASAGREVRGEPGGQVGREGGEGEGFEGGCGEPDGLREGGSVPVFSDVKLSSSDTGRGGM